MRLGFVEQVLVVVCSLSIKTFVRSIFPVMLVGLLTACNSSDDSLDKQGTDDGREINSSSTPDGGNTDNSNQGSGAPQIGASGPAAITDLVLITGQSNALGSQTTYDETLDQPVEGFYAYTDQGWKQASLRQVWDLGWHPSKGLGDDPHNNFGFHFGKQVVANSNRVVGILSLIHI